MSQKAPNGNATGASEEQKKLTDTMDNSPAGFFAVDETGAFTFANATFARWVGEKQETILKDYLSCDSRLINTACGKVNPSTGVNINGSKYKLATWASFKLKNPANLSFAFLYSTFE